MIYTLAEVKKEMKAMYNVSKIVVWLEEFGEGYNVYSTVYHYDKWYNEEREHYDLAEEEKKSKAEARAKRVVESLKKQGYKAEYEGIANC